MNDDELLDGYEELEPTDEAELSLDNVPEGAGAATRELVDFVKNGEDVDAIPFEDLRPEHLGALGSERFLEYLEWRQVFGGVEEEEEPEPPEMPGYGHMSEADFEAYLAATINSQEAS